MPRGALDAVTRAGVGAAGPAPAATAGAARGRVADARMAAEARHGMGGADGIRPGLVGQRRVRVDDAMATSHVGGRRKVLTTPTLILLMEETAQAVTDPLLAPDGTTVGFEIVVRHRRPVFVGEDVVVTTELLAVEGRKLLFRFEARSDRGPIAEGTHRRTVIQLGSLEAED